MRKPKYHKDYPEALIEHMKTGNSFEAFAALISVTEETLNNWCRNYPEFKQAKSIGKMHELAYWEGLLKKGAHGDLPPVKKRIVIFDEKKQIKQTTIIDEPGKFNATAVIFALKNKFRALYRDQIDVKSEQADPLDKLTDEEIKQRKELYASILEKKRVK
jgi:hypothetical protein